VEEGQREGLGRLNIMPSLRPSPKGTGRKNSLPGQTEMNLEGSS
jgi:hypothetical protein